MVGENGWVKYGVQLWRMFYKLSKDCADDDDDDKVDIRALRKLVV
ncbi:hypothetical protein RchiOBHm_Chr2g0101481 [Rosa chinensis]|uniref:Uncharacterized protein n=1 Tax=Rosa chinensis TaxID=74649 RepID=A0A2P6RMG1_ROSCH|nr:hypothetical protein RchiOBHm_Chr2g0101481 [Rosa chinensis]